ADEQPTRECQARQRLQPTFAERARAVGNALAALQQALDHRMMLETLEFLERRQVRIFVIESDDEADGDEIVFPVVEPRAAIGAEIHRPADAVLDQAGTMPGGIDLPDLLDAEAESLRIDALAQLETLEQYFGQRAAAAFGEHGLLRFQLNTAGETP